MKKTFALLAAVGALALPACTTVEHTPATTTTTTQETVTHRSMLGGAATSTTETREVSAAPY